MITIPKPCHEDWNQMTAQEQGRLCAKCCKVVVDFTQKTTEQIVDILQSRSSEKVCGRFRAAQVAVPFSGRRLAGRKLFLAALYFAFGSLLFTSCRTHPRQPEVMGKVKVENSFTGNPLAPDTARPDTVIPKEKKEKVCPKKTAEPKPEHFLMGDVAYFPEDSVINPK